MKRIRIRYEGIDVEKGYYLAKKGKKKWRSRMFDKNKEKNLQRIKKLLQDGKYKSQGYTEKDIICASGKVRHVKIAHFVDLIVQHAVLEETKRLANKTMIHDSYCCIEGKGQIACFLKVRLSIDADREGTRYFSEMDIRKFYPSVNTDILSQEVNAKFKGSQLHKLHDDIICSSSDLPVGNPFSPHAANLMLNCVDHYAKEVLKIKYYIRYADDIRIMGNDAKQVLEWQDDIKRYIKVRLNLNIKPTGGVHDINKRPIDFMGYIIHPEYTLVRQRIKKAAFKKAGSKTSLASYYGVLKHADCINLLNKLFERYERKQNKRIQRSADASN
ncbi:MAG: RNA-directed DNA polymerase [Marinifilaceae bacterium]